MPDVIELTPEETKFFATQGAEAPETVESVPAKEVAKQDQRPEGDDNANKGHDPSEADSLDKDEKPSGTVPQKALHEERERRKAAQKDAEEARTNFTKLQSRLDTLQEIARSTVQRSETPTAPVTPDINTDPVGHFKAKTEALERELSDTRKWRTEQEQRGQATNNIQRIAQIAQAKEAEFKQTAPDYDDASTHLRNLREAQLIAYGITDPMRRGNIIAEDAITIAATALSENKNPAEIIYNMAKASGYAKKAVEQAQAVDNTPSETKKVQMARDGQKAGASIQQINGAASKTTTMQALLEMNDDEFAAATKGDKWKKLLAG